MLRWLVGSLRPLRNLIPSGSYFVRNVRRGLSTMLEDRTTAFYFVVLVGLLGIGLLGPTLAPYEYDETQYAEDGRILIAEGPTTDHPLGTTDQGYDVLSRILYGAQPTVITGLLGGSLIIVIGTTVGMIAGYVGGLVDEALMRITDVFYGIPPIPTAIVLVALFGAGYLQSVLVIGLLLWRGPARVTRAQVLQIKEREFITATQAIGASRRRIIVKHVFPNVAPTAVLFFSFGIGFAIIIQASLSFLGVTNPFVPSWGVMVRNAFDSGLMAEAWWWSITPGALISLTVLSTFMFGRGIESLFGQTDEAMVQG